MTDNSAIAPLYIQSNIDQEVQLLDNVTLKPLTPDKKKEIEDILQSGWIPLNPEMRQANYCLFIENGAKEKLINIGDTISKAIRVIRTGSSGCLYIITWANGERNIIRPGETENPSSIIPPTLIALSDIDFLRLIIQKIMETKDAKFNLMIWKYLYATSRLCHTMENMFTELTTILEMLYGCNISQELRFRISLTIAKMFSKHNLKFDDSKAEESTKDRFDIMKRLYDTRSKIVHTGKYKDFIPANWFFITEITRKSLLLYLMNPDEFNDENLINILCS